MDTKWKMRTASRGLARSGVKFVCLALSVVLTASAAAAAMTLVPWGMNLSEKEDYVTSYFGESTERYFSYEFQRMFYSIQALTQYKDRDSIANGDYLKWESNVAPVSEEQDPNADMVLKIHLRSKLDGTEYAIIDFTPQMSGNQLKFNMEREMPGAVQQMMADQAYYYESLPETQRQRFLQGEYLQWVPEWHQPYEYNTPVYTEEPSYDDGVILNDYGISAVPSTTPAPMLETTRPPELQYNLVSSIQGDDTLYAAVPFKRDMSGTQLLDNMERELENAAWNQRVNNEGFYANLTTDDQQRFREGAYLTWMPEWIFSAVTDIQGNYHYELLHVNGRDADVYSTLESEVPLEEDSPRLRDAEQSAIRRQLENYDYAAANLSSLKDLAWWYASETLPDGTVLEYGETGLSYALNNGEFSTYARWEKGSLNDSKVMGKNLYWRYSPPYTNGGAATVYIGYDPYFVTTVYDARKAVQDHIAGAILWIVLLLLPALALFCVAAVGVGRRVTIDGSVELINPRKLWLEVLLAIIAVPFGLIVMDITGYRSMIYYAVQYYVDAGQEPTLYLLTALLAGLLALPVALWLLAVIHRVKAERFWRHTLVWAILALLWRILRGLWRGMRRLFGALPLVLQGAAVMLVLTVEVAVIASTAAHTPEFCLLFAVMCFVFDSVFIGMILTQLRTVERSAAAAARGEEAKVPPMFGVFGRIGRSVGNLSGNVALAVEDRMKSERMKTELITNVSHDIRTPLTSLIAYVDLLQTEGLDSDNAPEYVTILAQKAQRLKALTDDLFEASKAASGNVNAELETLDLSALTRQVLGEMDERIAQSGLDFRVTLPEHAPAKGDGRMMWRVMENLIDNALKYSLPSSRVYLSLETDSGEVRLLLKNVSALPLSDQLSELTDRFKRGDESRSTEGSGLGLSIVQSFMDNQGGRLTLSADGDLFKACVTLPVG